MADQYSMFNLIALNTNWNYPGADDLGDIIAWLTVSHAIPVPTPVMPAYTDLLNIYNWVIANQNCTNCTNCTNCGACTDCGGK